MNTRSNTTLLLENGCYHINSFTLLQDLSNISLIGSGSETTIVKCQGDVGLAFVNISRLLISDVTITNCRLSGENLQNAFDLVKESLDMFYTFRNGTIVGIFIGDTSDLQARNMIVQNTPGIGMVVINLMGESDMSNVTFTNNNVPDIISSCGVGGGLFILYADYHNHTPNKTPQLTISASLFKMNYNCIIDNIFENWIGVGGGLSIILSQNSFPVDISITSTTIENKLSPLGAVSIVFHTGVSKSSVNISSSMLRKNGKKSIIGALFIVFNTRIPVRFLRNVSAAQLLPNTVTMGNTTIEENQAQTTGGVAIFSFSSPLLTKRNENLVLFKSCKFFGNESPNGAAFAFQSLVYSGFDPSTSIIFEDVSIEQNRETDSSSINTAVAYLSSVNLTIRGKSQLIENMGSALLLSRSIITVEGDLRFINNSGSRISLQGFSNIVLRRGSALILKGNRAANKGGAIFVQFLSSFTDLSQMYDCFLWFEEVSIDCRFFEHCQNVPQPNNATIIVFENNQAPVGGTIYGSRLSTCPWAVYPNGTKPSSGIAFLQQLPLVTINPSVLNSSVVSTDAFDLVRNISQPI